MLYMAHCEANHPDYGDWLNRWRGINGFFFLPSFLIAVVGVGLRSILVASSAFALFIILYIVWSVHSGRVVGQFRELWQEQHGAPIETDE